ncbi:MAG: DUF2922 domain-containing protein [Clostridia bacterium]|nr:DUF2922 domain-containing protein [Clostridia bacterium]
MIFRNEDGNRVTISVQEPRTDLTPQEVQEAMELITSNNVFTSNGGDLVSIESARLVTRDVEELF